MQLTCPNCGTPISADNINIQQMMAVCSACNTIFEVQRPQAKAKRRKVKRPLHISVDETDTHVKLAFRTNFRLDKDENFIGSVITSVILTFMTLLFSGEWVGGDDVPFVFFIGFGLATVFAYYWLALNAYNKTVIDMDDSVIRVSRQPLPNPLEQGYRITVSDVVAIRTEETEISKKEHYDTPRYRVWAERADGSQRTIVNDVTEEYAYYIAQILDEHLHKDGEQNLDMSRLVDDRKESSEGVSLESLIPTQKTDHQSR